MADEAQPTTVAMALAYLGPRCWMKTFGDLANKYGNIMVIHTYIQTCIHTYKIHARYIHRPKYL
jgi:hypothetical protein